MFNTNKTGLNKQGMRKRRFKQLNFRQDIFPARQNYYYFTDTFLYFYCKPPTHCMGLAVFVKANFKFDYEKPATRFYNLNFLSTHIT